MTTEPENQFREHSRDWYEKPLDYRYIIYEPDGKTHIARITLNRPEKMNAMSYELRGELIHALKVAERNKEINVIVIKGAGRCFSSGYDLTSGPQPEPDFGSQYVDNSPYTHIARSMIQQWWQIWELSKVVIAQTHGYCLAGGSELAAMCDLMVTTPDCQFGYPPLRSMGVDMFWFPWLLPMRKAHELALTGGNMTGEEVYRLGMANYCVPDNIIEEFTTLFAKRVALLPWQIATQYKRAVKKAYEMQGIRVAMETGALFAHHRVRESDYGKQMDELVRKVPLREYLAIRDKPYNENWQEIEALLKKAREQKHNP